MTPLIFIPPEMNEWGMQLVTPDASLLGEFVLVGCEQADIEQHHQVTVIDEDGRPMRGVDVIFGYDTGNPINLPPRANHWRNAPNVLKGNAQRTNAMGYAQHTVGEGGENIWVWYRNGDGDLLYPSPIVRNCTWKIPPLGRFNHTGVSLTFQLQRVGVVPLLDRLSAVEEWITTFDQRLKVLEK
jgi:hypothetical protein